MSISYWQDNSKNQVIESDIAIIGGGIAGLSTAYWLHKQDPNLRLSVIEKGALGSGATGRNAGFITCGSVEHFNRLVGTHGPDLALKIWHFSETNLQLLREEILDDSSVDIGFENKGSFSLASTLDEFEELKKSYSLMKGMGISVEVLTDRDIKNRLGVVGFVGGIKYIQDASVHPLKLLSLLRKKLEINKNIQFYENHEVFSIEQDRQIPDLRRILTQERQFHCPFVVMATNAYSPLLNEYFADKIYPTRGQILTTEPLPIFMEGPCYANFVLDYFRQLTTGELIIGGFRQLQKDAEIGYADMTSKVIQTALEEFLHKHIPKARSKKITHRWSGIMGFSADGQPLIGSLPNDPNIFFLGGFTAHGLGLAFHSGKCLVDLIYGSCEVPAFISARRF